jgi:plasmid maintenance system antidote protein VapI
MALRFEMAFGIAMDTLLRMQLAYDVAQARVAGARIRIKRFAVPA